MSKNRVNLLNFGATLKESVIEDIEKEHDIEVEQFSIKASLNLKKRSTYIQVHDIIEENIDRFFEKDYFIINLPGLPIFAAFLISEIHGLTGRFPIVVECIKDFSNDGIFTDYKFKRLYDLDRERTQSRENFKSFQRSK